MLTNHKNTKKQGDVGLGCAISYFCREQYTVCIPLTDSQDYDLIVEKDGKLQRVQVKTTTFKSKCDIYIVGLKTCGGNRSSSKIKKFDYRNSDLLYVVTNDNEQYVIPTYESMPKNTLNLGKEYQKYKVI